MLQSTSDLVEEIRGVLTFEHDEKRRKLLLKTVAELKYLSGKIESLRQEYHWINSIGTQNVYAHGSSSTNNNQNDKTTA